MQDNHPEIIAERLRGAGIQPEEVPAHQSGANWAGQLLKRDLVQGSLTLERMVAYYTEHDGKADDFGRLHIVVDATNALARVGIIQIRCPAGCRHGCDQCEGAGWVWQVPNHIHL
jgi:hypothetical protein